MTKSLEGKIALVTGGSSGIGKAVSIRLADEGAKVAVVSGSDRKRAQNVVDEIVSSGGDAKAFVCDVRKVTDIKGLVRDVVNTYATIDILITAAGVASPNIVGETQENIYDYMADINLKGLYFIIDEVVPIMKAKKSGKIITFASNAAFVGIAGIPIYCALKAAVVMLTKCLALQLAPYSININAIAPGNTATPMNEPVRTKPEYAEDRAKIDANTPSTHKFSSPEEIAEMVLFLSTEKSRPMHGSTVLMDEGQSAGLL